MQSPRILSLSIFPCDFPEQYVRYYFSSTVTNQPLKIFNPIILSWKLFRLSLHLLSGLSFALLFVHDGIHNSPVASRFFIWWNRALCQIFKARIITKGKMNNEATLYVMNHISWFDIPVLASQKPLHFLSKAEVRSWPLIGWLSHRAGTLFIQRGASGAAQKSLEEITDCLKNGGSVVIFPEGTTTDGSVVRKFHGRLLQAAIDAGVKIQPVALRYPYENGLNHYVPYIDNMTFIDSVMGLTRSHPLCVELHFLEPIDLHIENSDETLRHQLAQQARQAITKELGIK